MTDYNSASTKSNKGLIAIIAITALLLVILYALGILGGEKKIDPGLSAATAQALPNSASTLKLSTQTTENLLAWQGSIRSRLQVNIAPKLTARIVEIQVHPGDQVKKGALLVRLDDRDLQAAYQAANAGYMAAQAQANQAKSEQQRIIDLFQKQAATRQNYDVVLAQARSAQAMADQAASQVQQSRVMLSENQLIAPFDAVVAERLQEPGDMAMPNQAIISLFKPDDLRLDVAIADRCAHSVKLGMNVNVRIDGLAQPVSGKIDEISPEINSQSHSLTIKVSLPKNPGIQVGQFAWLDLACQAEHAALLIPETAMLHYGQLQAVKVLEAGTVHIRHIRTGKHYAEQWEVLSGLHAGETILVNGGYTP